MQERADMNAKEEQSPEKLFLPTTWKLGEGQRSVL